MAYDLSGVSQTRTSPLFINLQPFKLDLSPIEKTQELRDALRLQVQQKVAEQQKQIADLKMPEFKEGLAIDKVQPYQQALAAREQMLSRLRSGANPFWIYQNDPEFRQAMQSYTQATSPVTATLLKEQQDQLDAFDAAVAKKPGAAASYFTDADGNLVTDPDTGIPLTAGEGGWQRRNLISRSVQNGGLTDFGHYTLGTQADYTKHIDDTFREIGESKFGGNFNAQSKESWEDLMKNAKDPEAGLLSALVINEKFGGNAQQVKLAAKALRNEPRTAEDNTAILNAYMQDPKSSFLQKFGEDIRKGSLNTSKVLDEAINGGGKEGSYVDQWVMDRANRFLKDEHYITGDFKQTRGGAATDENGNTIKKINRWRVIRAGAPADAVKAGEMPLPVAFINKEGKQKVTVMSAPAYRWTPPPDLLPTTMKDIGLYDSNGDLKPDKDLTVFGTGDVYTAYGRKIPDSVKSTIKITGVDPQIWYINKLFGSGADQDTTAAKKNGLLYRTVDAQGGGKMIIPVLPDSSRQQDVSQQVAAFRIPVTYSDDGVFNSFGKEYVPGGRDGGQPTLVPRDADEVNTPEYDPGWFPLSVGSTDTKSYVWVKVPEGYEQYRNQDINVSEVQDQFPTNDPKGNAPTAGYTFEQAMRKVAIPDVHYVH
jgi:hypothetical protein